MNETMSADAQPSDIRSSVAGARSSLFIGMGIILVAIVLVGFSPTFFLRGFFDVAPIPPLLYVHGTLMSGWFVLFLVQACLVRTGSVHIHRRLGVAAAIVGLGALATAIIATWDFPLNSVAKGFDIDDPATLLFNSKIVWGNSGALLAFAAFLGLGIYHRKQPYIHRRMMLFAAISFVGPALGRVAGWPIAEGIGLSLFNNTGISLLVLGVLAYELVFDRRIHRLTAIAVVALFAVRILFTVVIPASAGGLAITRSMALG